MARTSIRARSNDAVVDNGSVNISLIKGEQRSFVVTHNGFTNLAEVEITGSLIEGDNSAADGNVPTQAKSGASVQRLVILEEDGTELSDNKFPNDYGSNKFKLVFEDNLFNDWSPAPSVGDAGRIYGFFAVTVKDTGTGDNQEITKDLRGTVTVRYAIGG